MKFEIRADGTHILGYVNVPEKKSTPLPLQGYGMVVETIEPKAFQRAIDRSNNIRLTVDHGETTYASTGAGTLKLYEDDIGLYADAIVSDADLIQAAKQNKIVGWSFGFEPVAQKIENQKNSPYPLRRILDMNLDHVSLIINQEPIYTATSWEIRDGCTAKKSTDMYQKYEKRLDKIKKAGYQNRIDQLKK